jgi:hypothetical protein
MRTLIIAAGVLLFCVTSAQAEEKTEFDFSGVKSCKKCHRKVWKTWKDSTMALSFDILKPGERVDIKKKAGLDPQKDYTQDATCLPCHTTGYGKTGGFVSMEKTPSMAGVSCESCHGPGKEYNKVMKKHGRIYTEEEILHAGLVKDPHTTCLSCHNENSPTRKFQDPFDAQLHDWPAHDEVKLKYHTPEYQATK